MGHYSPSLRSQGRTSSPARVVLVDDSALVRSILHRMLGDHPEFDVVASTVSAAEALAFLETNAADIIILDIEMPGQSGLEALPALLEAGKGAKVLILSSHGAKGGPVALEALALGACDTLAKPGSTAFAGAFEDVLIETLLSVADDGCVDAAGLELKTERWRGPPKCIAVGASTGGIPANYAFIASLPERTGCPILLTQHLPAAFTDFFARQIAGITGREVLVAKDNMRLRPDTIYLSPADRHLGCWMLGEDGHVRLTERSDDVRYTPSVDILFEQTAKCYGANAVAVILSGIGTDGNKGAAAIRDAGGAVIAQDPESSVVWGMPGSAVKAGLTTAVLDPSQMGEWLFPEEGGGRP